MAVPGCAQLADRREPGRAGPADDRAGAGGRGGRDRLRTGRDPGPAACLRRAPAPVARAPERARGDLLPGRDRGDGRPRARHTARHSEITAALRARCTTQATPAGRRDHGVLMNNRVPWDSTATDACEEEAGAAAAAQVARRLIVVLLLTAAALDLTRCGLVMTAARHPAPTAGLVAAGLAATGLTARTARGCQVGRRWAGWAALLIGAASAPQAVASGFRSPYTVPDAATAAVGLLLAITILATAGRTGGRETTPQSPKCRTGNPRGVPPGRAMPGCFRQ